MLQVSESVKQDGAGRQGEEGAESIGVSEMEITTSYVVYWINK